jgi:hypothetical protein
MEQLVILAARSDAAGENPLYNRKARDLRLLFKRHLPRYAERRRPFRQGAPQHWRCQCRRSQPAQPWTFPDCRYLRSGAHPGRWLDRCSRLPFSNPRISATRVAAGFTSA